LETVSVEISAESLIPMVTLKIVPYEFDINMIGNLSLLVDKE